MSFIIKRKYWLALLLACMLFSCQNDENEKTEAKTKDTGPTPEMVEARNVANALWSTTSLNLPVGQKRLEAFDKIQSMADVYTAGAFEGYLKSFDSSAELMERHDAILALYRLAFDRVINDLKSTKVENGTTYIWQLYNMGYIIKTPSACFGIDISHRWAKKLAPYLDFLCLTHNHRDHYSTSLIDAMKSAGKPVYSNFVEGGYTSAKEASYTFNDIKIRVSITDHNNSKLFNFVSVFSIDCGDDSGNFRLMHVGDSNYKPEQYTNIMDKVNVLIVRYAPNALTENNILGEGKGQIQPDYILLSHILELAHENEQLSRWSLKSALKRAAKLHCANTIVPFWGEKLVWKNGKLIY